VAALALAARPTLDRVELRQLMIAACHKVGTLPYVNGHYDDYGYGRVNANRTKNAPLNLSWFVGDQNGPST
jgi:hypothetical protein